MPEEETAQRTTLVPVETCVGDLIIPVGGLVGFAVLLGIAAPSLLYVSVFKD
jgi:hypothetical protein